MTQNGSGYERLKTTELGKDIFGNIFSVGGIFALSASCALGEYNRQKFEWLTSFSN